MRGVCVDYLNPYGAISPGQFKSLGIDFVRAEIRTDCEYLDVSTAFLYGPSTVELYIPVEAKIEFIIIGNEPDGDGDSSWKMSRYEYIAFYNDIAAKIPQEIRICAAGLVKGPQFLQDCWDSLIRKPDIVNCHYPNNENDIIAFRKAFNCPVMVGETCWYTASLGDMEYWLSLLDHYCEYWCWFCLDNKMVDKMGLYNGRKLTTAGRKFKKAITTL